MGLVDRLDDKTESSDDSLPRNACAEWVSWATRQ